MPKGDPCRGYAIGYLIFGVFLLLLSILGMLSKSSD